MGANSEGFTQSPLIKFFSTIQVVCETIRIHTYIHVQLKVVTTIDYPTIATQPFWPG